MDSFRSLVTFQWKFFPVYKTVVSHMRALSGGSEGGWVQKICQKIGQRSQIPWNVSFQNFSLESQKSPNLTCVTQESQTFSQKLFTEKSKSQSSK